MAARKTTAKPRPKKCQDCQGTGEITETVHVGARKSRPTDHQQSVLCMTCWGTGTAS